MEHTPATLAHAHTDCDKTSIARVRPSCGREDALGPKPEVCGHLINLDCGNFPTIGLDERPARGRSELVCVLVCRARAHLRLCRSTALSLHMVRLP